MVKTISHLLQKRMPIGYTRLMEMAHVIICLNKIAGTEKNKKIKKISKNT